MTHRRARRLFGACAAALGVSACAEARIGLLDPMGASESPRLVEAGDGAGVRDDTLPNPACVRWSAEREPEAGLVMGILDVSGTMTLALPGSQTSRWDAEQSVLLSAVRALPARFGLGILYFPNMTTTASATSRPASACVNLAETISVDLLGAPDSAQRTLLAQSLARTEPAAQGGAATEDAYLAALDEIGRTSLDGTRQMLLVTDGEPTFSERCVGSGLADSPVDPSPVIDAISAARRAGIRTFVIGSLGSDHTNSRGDDARPWLSRAAEAGGTARRGCSDTGPNYCHYDTTGDRNFARGFGAALADIASRVERCDVPLPDPPQNQTIDLDHVNVVFTGADGSSTVFPRDETGMTAESWRPSSDGQRILLSGEACALVNGDLRTKLELEFGCATVTP